MPWLSLGFRRFITVYTQLDEEPISTVFLSHDEWQYYLCYNHFQLLEAGSLGRGRGTARGESGLGTH